MLNFPSWFSWTKDHFFFMAQKKWIYSSKVKGRKSSFDVYGHDNGHDCVVYANVKGKRLTHSKCASMRLMRNRKRADKNWRKRDTRWDIASRKFPWGAKGNWMFVWYPSSSSVKKMRHIQWKNFHSMLSFG